MNQNTNNVDVLAVLERASRRYAAGSQAGQQMRDVRAAVAELIAALRDISSLEEREGDELGNARSIARKALARVGGAA